MNNIKKSSNKIFGIALFIIFFLISFYPLINANDIRIWSLVLSLIFLFLGIINSRILKPFNIICFKLGIFLGKIVSPIVMMIIFFFILTPLVLLMRIFGKDLLKLKFNKKKTYWIKKPEVKIKMKNQF